jgi:hypothetical protein
VEADDKLEQRVKTLEYEFKILKNEIQRTLLDIQEQILIHYYPALRAEESVPAPEVAQSLGSARDKQGANTVAPQVGEPETPQVKKVSLEDIRKAREEPVKTVGQVEGGEGSQGAQPNLIALTNWVNSAVSKIGKERAVKLVEKAGQKGYLADDTKDALIKLCTAIGEDSPAEKVAINDILTALLRLNEILGRSMDVEEALSFLDEAKLG